MEEIDKEAFGEWAKQNNWLKVNELSTPNGRQETYLTPVGTLRGIIYDLKGNFTQVANLGPPEPQSPPGPGFLTGMPVMGKG